MFNVRPYILLMLLVFFLQCSEDPGKKTELNVLFVGNSLTYVNDLPSLVNEIAQEDGVKLNILSITAGNYSLDDHWNEGTIQRAFEKNHFDFLIAQQGPSALPESQDILKASAILLADECARQKTRFALYMVWPSLDRDFDRDNCIYSYTNAAKVSGALLCPAGLAWKLAWEMDPKLPLYGPDRFHPGIHGSVLAALTIYASITQKKDLGFMKKSIWKEISDEHLDVMKTAALKSITAP